MILPILQYPDARLKRKAVPVEAITPEIQALAADMVETMYARDGIGLAAPQVGESIRLIVVDISGPEKREDLRILLNPVLELSGPEVESEEGCLSVNDFRSTLYRTLRVRCRATSLEGEPIEFDAEELLAICLQHECDHLEGKLFIDHISTLKRMMYDKRIAKRGK